VQRVDREVEPPLQLLVRTDLAAERRAARDGAPPRHLEACHRHAERLRRMARRRATWSARHAAARTPIETNIAVALDTQRG